MMPFHKPRDASMFSCEMIFAQLLKVLRLCNFRASFPCGSVAKVLKKKHDSNLFSLQKKVFEPFSFPSTTLAKEMDQVAHRNHLTNHPLL
jgi:hypothetical protein